LASAAENITVLMIFERVMYILHACTTRAAPYLAVV
jgi:hypothetical protein